MSRRVQIYTLIVCAQQIEIIFGMGSYKVNCRDVYMVACKLPNQAIHLKTGVMSELQIIHFLKISGMISEGSRREFENTVRHACGLFPGDCLVKNLSVEIFTDDTYYFFSQWETETALRKFIQSEEYQLIRTAYDVLGVLEKIEIGYHIEIKTIRIHY
jgi:hypothetical protein